jgi:hypothetical protein
MSRAELFDVDGRPLYEYDYSYYKWILTNGHSSFPSIPILLLFLSYRLFRPHLPSCSGSSGQWAASSTPSFIVVAPPALGCFSHDILGEKKTKCEVR